MLKEFGLIMLLAPIIRWDYIVSIHQTFLGWAMMIIGLFLWVLMDI